MVSVTCLPRHSRSAWDMLRMPRWLLLLRGSLLSRLSHMSPWIYSVVWRRRKWRVFTQLLWHSCWTVSSWLSWLISQNSDFVVRVNWEESAILVIHFSQPLFISGRLTCFTVRIQCRPGQSRWTQFRGIFNWFHSPGKLNNEHTQIGDTSFGLSLRLRSNWVLIVGILS